MAGDFGGYVIRGKFDNAVTMKGGDGAQSDSVLFRALDSFFVSFVEAGRGDKDGGADEDHDALKGRMRERIEELLPYGLG